MPLTDNWNPGERTLRRIVALQRGAYVGTGGRVFAHARGKPMLLLTTTGRRTGVARTAPLPYMPYGDEMVVIGSNSGGDRHPAWYLNIEANPAVGVQVGPRSSTAKARTVAGEERAALWDRVVEYAPWYEEYQASTDRRLPLVAITPGEPLRHDAPVRVERPALGWWVAILAGMTSLGLVAFNPRAWRWWTRNVTGAVPRGAFRSLFWAAVATHVAEGSVAVRVAERDGRHAAALGWGAQTFLLGFPSLGLLRGAVSRQTVSASG